MTTKAEVVAAMDKAFAEAVEKHAPELKGHDVPCARCGHVKAFHGIGTGAGVPLGQGFCDDRHDEACSCAGFVTTATLWDLVVVDMKGRDAFGTRKYGRPLEPNDGRDTLRDAYEEALDLAVYLRKALHERDGR